MRNLLLFAALLLSCSLNAGDWPQWRGMNRDGFAATDEKITPEALNEPKRLWHIPVGGGFSSPIISGQTVIYLNEHNGKEVAHAVETDSGKEGLPLLQAVVVDRSL